MTTPVVVEVTRALRWDGETIRPGMTLKLSPLEAQQALDSGRAKLIHADDAVLCIQAVRKDVQAQLKAAGGSSLPPPGKDWQWQHRLSVPLS
jgi:hypothetical protein